MFITEKLGKRKYKVTCTECGNIKFTTHKPKATKCSALTCGEQFYIHNYIGKTYRDMTILGKENDNFIIKCNICGFVTKVRLSNFLKNEFHNQEHSNCHKILFKQVDDIEKFQNFKERWRMMLRRCCDQNHKSYNLYSKVGICERWKDFMLFYNDMYSTFKVELQIDRIDGTKGYSKENCRWVTQKENCINRTTTKNAIAYNLKTNKEYILGKETNISIHDFAKEFNISSTNIYDKLNKHVKKIEQNEFVFFNNRKEMQEYFEKNNYPSVESNCDK